MQRTLSFITGLAILIVFLIWGNLATKLGLSTVLTIIGYIVLLVITTIIMTIITVYIQNKKAIDEDKKRDQ